MQGRAPLAANLHLTLVFVGDISARELPSLSAVGKAAAAAGAPLSLNLDRGGMFRASGIAWIGASSSPASLLRVVQSLTAGLWELGIVVDLREFVPHITLARRCRRAGAIAFDSPIVWPIGRIALYASEAGVSGPEYRELDGWALGGSTGRDSVTL